MQSSIVNGYQFLCDARSVLEPHRGTAAFSFYSLLYFCTFSFYVFVTLTVPISFFGASLVCVNNLKEESRFSLLIPCLGMDASITFYC